MKQTVTLNTFRGAFQDIRPNNFSYESLETLYEYLTDLEESCGEEMELDVIAICCDWSEYYLEDALREYGAVSLEQLRVTH